MCKTLDYSVLTLFPPAPDCVRFSVRSNFKKNNIKIIHYFVISILHFYYINTYYIFKFIRFVSFKKKHLKKSCEFHLSIIFLQRQTKTNDFMKVFEIKDLSSGKVFHMVKVSDLKKGELFSRVPYSVDDVALEKNVLVRGFYERSLSKYEAYYFANTCRETFLKGDKMVYVDFLF